MKISLIFLLFICNICKAQEWQAELMAGVSAYNGDLTQKRISLNLFKPAVSFNIKYNSEDYINFRAGISYAKIGADDKNNPSTDLKERNLNFKSDIIELNLIMELNLFDPESYTSYPYVFGGVGIFHFNPYTYDDNNKRTYLQPLSTEGEGLKEYPTRKKYSLYQVCVPIGIGWKWKIKEKWELSYEFGYRITFTDYLDDVSKGYVDFNILTSEKGPKAAELSYRGTIPFVSTVVDVRGNSTFKDIYFFNGLKITTSLSNLFNKAR